MKKTISILGMLIFLAGSVFFDQRFYQLEKFTPDFQPGIPFWTELPIYIVFAGLSLILAWVVLVASPRSFFVDFIFIAAGLSALIFLTKFAYYSIWPWINEPQAVNALLIQIVSSPLALTRHAAAFILMIGLVGLLPEKLFRYRS